MIRMFLNFDEVKVSSIDIQAKRFFEEITKSNPRGIARGRTRMTYFTQYDIFFNFETRNTAS